MRNRKSELIRSRVSSDVSELNILNMIYPWVPNETQVRPTPEQMELKRLNLAALDQQWRSMRDYILYEIFGKHPCVDDSNKLCTSDDAVSVADVRFCPSHFPYNIQAGGKHWVLWFGCHEEPNLNINNIIAKMIKERAGHDDFDFAWYPNPKMSLPDFYHVHVFWTILDENKPIA